MSNNLKKGLKQIWWVFPAIYFIMGIMVMPQNLFHSTGEINGEEFTKYWALFFGGLIVMLVTMRNWPKEDKPPIIEEKDSTEDKEK